jgi:hypothetical protein
VDLTEDLLHYFWKTGWLSTSPIRTISGESVEIIQPGIHNSHSGPDFEQALLKIADTTWAGNVEMHIRASDWYNHRHEQDEAYNNVILHVVYIYDRAVFRQDGTEISVIELKSTIPETLVQSYRQLMSARSWIPCASSLKFVDEYHLQAFLSRVMTERLEAKYFEIIGLLEEQKGSWDNSFYIYLAKHFGFKTNALPFEWLAKSIPQQILAKHKNKPLQIEALIFGQAGFLTEELREDYPQKLKAEYNFLRKKYCLTPLSASIWKYMRMRPANFPLIRLAQFTALILKSEHLFSKILKIEDPASLKLLFSDLPVDVYWEHHYQFGQTTKKHAVQIGMGSIHALLINVLANFLFSYGKYHGNDLYCSRAIYLLEQLPAENNQITRKFKEIGLGVQSAFGSQALLMLKKNYCDHKKCLFCSIGSNILQRNHDSAPARFF